MDTSWVLNPQSETGALVFEKSVCLFVYLLFGLFRTVPRAYGVPRLGVQLEL